MIHLVESYCDIDNFTILPVVNSDEGRPVIEYFPTFYGSSEKVVVVVDIR